MGRANITKILRNSSRFLHDDFSMIKPLPNQLFWTRRTNPIFGTAPVSSQKATGTQFLDTVVVFDNSMGFAVRILDTVLVSTRTKASQRQDRHQGLPCDRDQVPVRVRLCCCVHHNNNNNNNNNNNQHTQPNGLQHIKKNTTHNQMDYNT